MKIKILAFNQKYNFIFAILFLICLVFSLYQKYDIYFWISVYFVYFLSFGLGVGMTLHRVISHSAAKIPKPLLYFFAYLGSISQSGPPLKWLVGHNLHHQFADTPKDPILPTLKGLNHLLGQFNPVAESEFTKILLVNAQSPFFKDRFLKSLDDYHYFYTLITYLVCFVFFGIKGVCIFVLGNIGALAGTSIITYLAHVKKLGSSDHVMPNSSVNMYGLFLFFFGEEIHNNHHAHPKAISNSEQPLQVDIIGSILNLIKT